MYTGWPGNATGPPCPACCCESSAGASGFPEAAAVVCGRRSCPLCPACCDGSVELASPELADPELAAAMSLADVVPAIAGGFLVSESVNRPGPPAWMKRQSSLPVLGSLKRRRRNRMLLVFSRASIEGG